MTFTSRTLCLLAIVFFIERGEAIGNNLSCYQCTRRNYDNCLESDLKPCPSSSDRCVTHIKKNVEKGFSISRECGLAPCSFNDDMVSKGLGLDNCDQNKKEFSCISCCKENACNRNSGNILKTNYLFKLIMLAMLVLLTVIRKFQPPYISQSEIF